MLELIGELTQPLGRDIGDVLMAELCDERFTDRERFRLRPPPGVLPLIVARVALGRAGEVVGGGGWRRRQSRCHGRTPSIWAVRLDQCEALAQAVERIRPDRGAVLEA